MELCDKVSLQVRFLILWHFYWLTTIPGINLITKRIHHTKSISKLTGKYFFFAKFVYSTYSMIKVAPNSQCTPILIKQNSILSPTLFWYSWQIQGVHHLSRRKLCLLYVLLWLVGMAWLLSNFNLYDLGEHFHNVHGISDTNPTTDIALSHWSLIKSSWDL